MLLRVRLPLARPLHARPDERRAVVRRPGRGGRRDRRRHRVQRCSSRGTTGWPWATRCCPTRAGRRMRSAPGTAVRRLDPAAVPVSTALGVLGMPGFTAYAGLLEIGRPQPGETVVVAAATGPVGSAVGQIAKIKGARAVGIAGGPDKVPRAARGVRLRRRGGPPLADFRERPGGGGAGRHRRVLRERRRRRWRREVFKRLNLYARVPVCGLVADYNATSAPEGPRPAARLHAPGADQEPDRPRLHPGRVRAGRTAATSCATCPGWVADGSVRYREDVVEGLENAPEAFRGLLAGAQLRQAAGQGVLGHTRLWGLDAWGWFLIQ